MMRTLPCEMGRARSARGKGEKAIQSIKCKKPVGK
jgi:hypothetical protein